MTLFETLRVLRERYPEIDLPRLPDIGTGTWPLDMMEYTVFFYREVKNGTARRMLRVHDGHARFKRFSESAYFLDTVDFNKMRDQIYQFADDGYVISQQKLVLELDNITKYKPTDGEYDAH